MWGSDVETLNVDFEWPSTEVHELLHCDIKVKSIELKNIFGVISSIKISLSNGLSSPEFKSMESMNLMSENAKLIEFRDDQSIRSVSSDGMPGTFPTEVRFFGP